MWRQIFFGLAVIYAVCDFGLALWSLISSIDPTAPLCMSPVLLLSFSISVGGVYLLTAGVSGFVLLKIGNVDGEESSDVRFYMVHFFKCALGGLFSMFWMVGWWVKYETFVNPHGLTPLPVFLLEATTVYTTTADMVTMDIAFIIFRLVLAFQMIVSIVNIRDLIDMFHISSVTSLLRIRSSIPLTKRTGQVYVQRRPRN